MSHLNGLQEKYQSQGLSILAIANTRDDADKTRAWVEKRGVEYPWAWDPGGELMGWFGIRGIPHAVLVDPSGKILWRGHPAKLDEKLLGKALESALEKPIWEVPTVHEALKSGRYAAAMAAAEKLGDGSGGPAIAALLRQRVKTKMASIAGARERGDYLGAQELAEQVAQQLAGLPEAVTAAEVVTALQKDAEAQRVIGGQIQLRALAAQVETVRTMTDARTLLAKLEEMRDAFEGTFVAKQAGEAIARLEKRMG